MRSVLFGEAGQSNALPLISSLLFNRWEGYITVDVYRQTLPQPPVIVRTTPFHFSDRAFYFVVIHDWTSNWRSYVIIVGTVSDRYEG